MTQQEIELLQQAAQNDSADAQYRLAMLHIYGDGVQEDNVLAAQLLEAGPYFQLNHAEATAETLRFVELIRQNAGKVAAVFAGHLHFLNVSEIAPGVPQYVSTQGITGNMNRYEIGE